ncbi:hypothetical protein THRCLA_04997 [Thraustotheca clavata]|uniref:Uncharacterized protein n=1 Tax=Thraustotheca clavata TaxID=74557 RepID=A0A1V9ZX97_9STRA|nr:hypothetical protein THRCLA_04997 [Thraustotheca clavata]
MEGYLRFRRKCKQWQAAHDRLVQLVHAYQAQVGRAWILGTRPPVLEDEGIELIGPRGFGGNGYLDVYLTEDTYGTLCAYPRKVQDLLCDMYEIYQETKNSVRRMKTAEAVDKGPSKMQVSPMEYVSYISTEVDMYESEYQHIEIVLSSMHFETPLNLMNAFMTSLSTQPFLDIETIMAITERHNHSYRLMKAVPHDEWV